MKTKALKKITDNLESVLEVLNGNELWDKQIRQRYAEYHVAHELSKRGHHVTLLSERDVRSADIYIKGTEGTEKRIEVKSGKQEDDRWAYASFGDGNQIKKDKFDYCVFIVFDGRKEGKIREIFAFTAKELHDLPTASRNGYARHKSNQCLLSLATHYDDYADWVKKNKFRSPPIEKQLNTHPKKYRKQWMKLLRNGNL